jgi:beta-1,4-mannosyltransferase
VERLRLARFPPSLGRNPYMDLLYDALRRFGVDFVAEPPLTFRWLGRARNDVDVLHFHWRPDRYYAWLRPRPEDLDRPPPRSQNIRSWLRVALFGCRLRIARLLGYRIVWTMHEVYPPESSKRPEGAVSRRIDRVGSRLLARRSDVLVTHDHATAERARRELGRAFERLEIVPHPSYLGVYPAGRARAVVRAELGIAPDAFTFLCFGALRPEKSIDLVLDAFRAVDDPSLALVVAGIVEDAGSRRSVLAASAVDDRVRPWLEQVPHERVAELFGAADVAVFGRSQVWTSGSLILALSLGVPAIASDLPPYDELLANGSAGWLFRPGDVESLSEAMHEAASQPELARAKGEVALRQAEGLLSWVDFAELTAGLILQSCNGRR